MRQRSELAVHVTGLTICLVIAKVFALDTLTAAAPATQPQPPPTQPAPQPAAPRGGAARHRRSAPCRHQARTDDRRGCRYSRSAGENRRPAREVDLCLPRPENHVYEWQGVGCAVKQRSHVVARSRCVRWIAFHHFRPSSNECPLQSPSGNFLPAGNRKGKSDKTSHR